MKCSMELKQGHASVGMQHGHAGQTCSMNNQHGQAAQTSRRTCGIYMQSDMLHGYAIWTCSMN
jgi:hypothetical protein